MTLHAIAAEASVWPDTDAESALHRGRTDLLSAMTALEDETEPYATIQTLLHRATVTMNYALSVAGIARDGGSVTELRIRLAALSEQLEQDRPRG